VFIDLVLATHLLAMNIASAGPLVALWMVRGRRGENADRRQLAVRVARLSLQALVVGALLGGWAIMASGEGLRAALGRFPASAYWFGLSELIFSAICIAGLARGVDRRWPFWANVVLALASASNLLYHFPPWMAVIGELAVDPNWASGRLLDHRSLLALCKQPEIAATWLHFVLASFAAAAIAALWISRQGDDESSTRGLGLWALVATACQIPAGVWMVVSRNDAVRDALLGGQWFATLLFAAGVLAALALLQVLLAVVLGEGEWAVRRATFLLVIVTLLMTATLRHSRGTSQRKKNSPDLARSGLLGALVQEPLGCE
jgi:hypothetical protein